jgi:hypothetical protein
MNRSIQAWFSHGFTGSLSRLGERQGAQNLVTISHAKLISKLGVLSAEHLA